MSETALTPPDQTIPTAASEALLVDGDAPRLGSTPLTAPAPMGGAGTPVSSVAPAPSAPDVPMQSIGDQGAPVAGPAPEVAPTPAIPTPELPTLPMAAPAAPTYVENADDDGASASPQTDDDHPMAHLMGAKAQVSAASVRAAELRAAKKAKAKKMKIGFAVAALVVTALVGPPLWSWFTNALNEAGGINTEEPAD